MFERFTRQARGVVIGAQTEARQLGHHRIGTEHVLLALTGDTGAAGRVLRALGATTQACEHALHRVLDRGGLDEDDAAALATIGIDLHAIRRQAEATFGPGALRRSADVAPRGHIPFTREAKKTLERSLREAVRLGHNHIGTEHILLGMLADPTTLGAAVLTTAGADLDTVRERLLAELRKAS